MNTMQQTHAQVCTRAYIGKKIPERPQKKKKQVNSTPACSTYSAETTPPSHCGVLPSGKKQQPEILLYKNYEAKFSHTLWPRVYIPTEAITPLWGGLESLQEQWLCNVTLQWQSK